MLDPSTFELTLNVLRSRGDEGNEMMKLVRYNIDNSSATAEDDIGSVGSE